MPTTYKKIIEKFNLTKDTKLLVVYQDDIGMCNGVNQVFKKLCSYEFTVNIPRGWW